MSKKDKTLKDILDLILYENPSTQDEIAERLGITRRYVTQLLQPLVKDGTVKRAYMIDLKSYEKIVESVGDYVSTRNSDPEDQGAVPITARQLEAIIRLSEASAKIKLKEYVEKEDAEKAVRLQRACLEDVGIDPETGKIDVGALGEGTVKTDRDKIQRVTEEIKLLEEEYAGNAPMNVLLSNMSEKYNLSEDKTEEIVRKLVQKGAIYEPQTGYYRSLM